MNWVLYYYIHYCRNSHHPTETWRNKHFGNRILWRTICSEERIENMRYCLKYSLRSFFSNFSSIAGPLTLFTPHLSPVGGQQYNSYHHTVSLSPVLARLIYLWCSKHDNYNPTRGFNVGFLPQEFLKLLSPGERVRGSSVTEPLLSTLGKQISIRYFIHTSHITHILPNVSTIVLAKLCFLSIKVLISKFD